MNIIKAHGFKSSGIAVHSLENNQAPKVIAKGEGHIADKIINEGTKHDVKIQEDKALVQLLYQLDIDEQIPETLYPIVAEVFALIYRAELNARMTKDV